MIFSPRDMFYAHHSTPLDTTGFACWASNDNNEHTNTFECASCYLTLPHKIWVIIKSRNWIIDYRRDKVCFFFSPFYFLFLFFLVFLFFTFIFVFFFVCGLFLTERFCVPDHIFRCSCHHYHHHRHRVNGHLCVLPILLWLLWIVVVVVVFSCFFFAQPT